MNRTLSVVLLTLAIAAPAAAKPKHWHDDDQKHGNRHEQVEVCNLPPQDVQIIREYYEPRSRSLPPGLAKKYRRTGQLPPGWQKKMEPLPVALERRLVVLPPEYRRGYIDGTVVVYSPRTQVVIDVVAMLGH
jgi:hypothetical protein